jgi:ectoine hydroxylase-related dioxygenase (phytanoyl-CoA dioxygenase family)
MFSLHRQFWRHASLRHHLDACGEENGALRVLPGTHRLGRVPEERIPAIRATTPEHVCVAD